MFEQGLVVLLLGAGALLKAADRYATKVETNTLASQETCWMNIPMAGARLEYETVRLGLMPAGTGWEFEDSYLIPVECHPESEINFHFPETEVIAALYRGKDRHRRLLDGLREVARLRPPGILIPFLVDAQENVMVALHALPSGYIGRWKAETFGSFYGRNRVTGKPAWAFLVELGEALSFMESINNPNLGLARDLHVDSAGRLALILGAFKVATASLEYKGMGGPSRAAVAQRDRLPYLKLWSDAGNALYTDRDPRQGTFHRMIDQARAKGAESNFAELFQAIRQNLEAAGFSE